ncbi:MAG: stage 0 sporulation protein, partial [Eubacteriales bacterium]|nr:stage 0 sporulation protein [Eubacteriales bacterium]
LNPTKISGVCGRLMCCLKFENDYYSEMYKKMPKVGSRAKTPDGEGVVESNDILKQQVKVKIMDKDGSFEIKTYDLSDVSARVHQSVEPDDSADDAELKKLED